MDEHQAGNPDDANGTGEGDQAQEGQQAKSEGGHHRSTVDQVVDKIQELAPIVGERLQEGAAAVAHKVQEVAPVIGEKAQEAAAAVAKKVQEVTPVVVKEVRIGAARAGEALGNLQHRMHERGADSGSESASDAHGHQSEADHTDQAEEHRTSGDSGDPSKPTGGPTE